MARTTKTPTIPLGRTTRRLTLVLHILSAGCWVGIDLIVAVLVAAGWFSDDDTTRALAYETLATFVVWPMLGSALVCLATGVLLGVGTKFGLVRYWWVLVKLVLNLALCTVIFFVLRPGMDDVAAYGHDLAAGREPQGDVSTLFFPPAVSLITLTFATYLGVFKPWGRVRSGRDVEADRLATTNR